MSNIVHLKGRKAGFANRQIGQRVTVDGNIQRFQPKGDVDPLENAKAPVCIYASKRTQLTEAILV